MRVPVRQAARAVGSWSAIVVGTVLSDQLTHKLDRRPNLMRRGQTPNLVKNPQRASDEAERSA